MFVFQVVMVSGRMSCVSGAWVGAGVGVGVGEAVGVRMFLWFFVSMLFVGFGMF